MEFNEVKPEYQNLYKIWFADCLLGKHSISFIANLGGYLCHSCGRMTVDSKFIEWFKQFKAIGECIDQGHHIEHDFIEKCFICVNCNDHIDELVLARGPYESLKLIDMIRTSTV